jgi:hypothetical protein
MRRKIITGDELLACAEANDTGGVHTEGEMPFGIAINKCGRRRPRCSVESLRPDRETVPQQITGDGRLAELRSRRWHPCESKQDVNFCDVTNMHHLHLLSGRERSKATGATV